MGRPRKHQSNLPPSVFESHGAYFHVIKGVWHNLGRGLAGALAEYGRRVDPKLKEGELNPLIDAAFDRMKNRKVDPLAENTTKQYTQACAKLKHLLRKFSRPDQVKQKDAAQVKMLLSPTPNWANRVISFGRQVFADLVEQQVIDSNPFLGVRRHKEGKRTRLIEQSEWDRIYLKAPPRLQAIMDVLFLTDQRIGDVLKIDLRDLGGEGIYVKQQKTKKELVIKWNDQLREAIARAKKLHGVVEVVDFKNDKRPRPLFRTRRGTRPAYRTVYDQWVLACERAGVEDCNLHDNRAFSATEAKRQGLDPQKLLGHTDAATTRIYLRGREVEVVEGPQMRRVLGA